MRRGITLNLACAQGLLGNSARFLEERLGKTRVSSYPPHDLFRWSVRPVSEVFLTTLKSRKYQSEVSVESRSFRIVTIWRNYSVLVNQK
ncbi:hypothetical protein A0H81_08027 [Grifola frondosa]|uniref:Uncharacterized protein n=1 Tax=Grifola frondosa TaxID=5627 RepID=A0A1C7M711_GRIFR|nr:hypothetical protein A0H81_08027 [Grifola frondosa]